MRTYLPLLLLFGACIPPVDGVDETSAALLPPLPPRRAILACDPAPLFMNECAAIGTALGSLGWTVRRPGELTSDYFPTTGAPQTYSASATLTAGQWQQYGFTVSAGTTLNAVITGTGDADLYVNGSAPPTETQYDCRPYSSTANETCQEAGGQQVYVGVRGYSPTSTFTLTVTWTRPTTTMTDLINSWVSSSVHSGDQVLLYVSGHGNTDSWVERDVSANPQLPYPFNDSGAYAPGPITSDRWPDMTDFHIGTTAATYALGNGVQSWDVHEAVNAIRAKNANVTVMARNCFDGGFTQMFRQEYGSSPNVCALGTTGPYQTAISGFADTSDWLNNHVLPNSGQRFTMEDFRRWIASMYESGLHGNPARNESSGYSNGCDATLDHRAVAQWVYNALGVLGGSVPAQPSYVISLPLKYTLNDANPASPQTDPTTDWDYHYQDGVMNWLGETRTRLLATVSALGYLTQGQKDAITTSTAQYDSTIASERAAWRQADTALVGTVGVYPQYFWNANVDLFYQLFYFAQTGLSLDVFLRRTIETRCLCGTTYSPQSALDCTGSISGSAENDLTCANPSLWINDVLAFYPAVQSAANSAMSYRSQSAAAMRTLSTSLAPIEQGCSSTACSSQYF